MERIRNKRDIVEHPRYHDTWRLLKDYRDARWNLVLSDRQARIRLGAAFGSAADEGPGRAFSPDAVLPGTLEGHPAGCMERSRRMIRLLDESVELLRSGHKDGEAYYWLLYYTYLSPGRMQNAEEVMEKLRAHVRDVSLRTYYRKRRAAIGALSDLLWGCPSKAGMEALEKFSFEEGGAGERGHEGRGWK